MSEKTFQAKLTEEELTAALNNQANDIICNGITDEKYDRFNYLTKRLLKIKKGDIEVENETQQDDNSPNPQGWV